MAFLCDAIYRGSHIVEGAVSPSMLTSLAEVVLNADQSIRGYAEICIDKLPRGDRCQLQIDEERLRVTSSRKDEGFESDSETSSASSTTGFDETLCGSPEIKVINDHVLRLEKLIRQDSGIHRCISQSSEDCGSASLSSSSGAESEEETPKKRPGSFKDHPLIHPSLGSIHKDDVTKDAKLTQMDTNNGDNFLMSDILFCHVLSHRPKVVIVVVKSIDSNLIAAHVFECLSAEAAKTLYSCYYTASNKYKLNRYRISKRRGEGLAPDDKAVLDRIHVSIRNVKRKNADYPPAGNLSYLYDSSPQSLPDQNNHFPRPIISSGDNSNINIIEIKDSKSGPRKPNGMMQRIDENGVTHIEIESAPISLAPIDTCQNPKPKLNPFELLSALDRLSIHSSNNPDSYLNYVGVTSSCPNSLIQASREIIASGDNSRDTERKSRQRQPPMLIKKEAFRKADSLSRKEVAKRSERRNRSRSEDGRILADDESPAFQKSSVESNAEESLDKLISETSKPQSNENPNSYFREELSNQDGLYLERQSRPRSTSRIAENRGRPHNKGPAPPPPPRRHPNNPSLMLVPTKNGQENTRAYYPKESHIVRGSKIVRIDYPVYPPWNINSDSNNNPRMMFYSHRGWFGSHEFHSSRRSDPSIVNDVRKRSRSKSPARRPMAHRYIDAVSTFSLTQKIKDLSDTVIQTWKNNAVPGTPGVNGPMITVKDGFSRVIDRKERKMNPPLSAAHFTNNNKNNCISHNKYNSNNGTYGEDGVRPVIKRGKKNDNSDARRVTFSAYATVQLMDS